MSVVLPEGKELWEVVSGLFANDSEFAFFPATGSPIEVFLAMSAPSQPWDAAGNITAKIRARILLGLGNYSLTFDHGEDDGVGGIVVRGSVSDSGALPSEDGNFETYEGVASVSAYPSAEDSVVIGRITVDVDRQADVRDEPVATEDAGEYTPVGEATLHEALAADGDDTKLVRSPSLNEDEKEIFVVEFDGTVPKVNDAIVVRVRNKALAPNMTVHFRLLDRNDDGDLVARVTDFKAASETVDNWDVSIPAAIVDDLGSEVYAEAGFTGSAGGGGGTQTVHPGIDVGSGGFSEYGSAGSFLTALSDSDDGTGVQSGPGANPKNVRYKAKFNGIEAPGAGDNSGHILRIRSQAVSGTGNILLTLIDAANGNIWQKTHTPSAAFVTDEFAIPEFKAAEITDYKNLVLRIGRVSDFHVRVSEAELELPGSGSQGEIYEVAAIAPGLSGIEVSWVNMEVDIVGAGILPGDNIKFYLGTKKRLYELKNPNFDWKDVSKGSVDYDVNGAKSWSMTAWGDKLIASNYIDPVQVFDLGDTEFEDLITSTDKPQFRTVATINAFLCGGNVHPDSYVDGRPFSFWCSGLGDPHYFHPADYARKSFLFQIVATPGEITKLVGGEYGILFKENSVYRIDFVGGEVLFQFQQLSGQAGTPFPRSVVVVGNDIYFWGMGALYVIVDGRELQEVGLGTLKKALFDSLFEELAMSSTISQDEAFNSSKVTGDFDPSSGQIVWSYQLRRDQAFHNRGLVSLDPKTGRISTGGGEDADPIVPQITAIPPLIVPPVSQGSDPVPYDFHPEVVSTPLRNVLPEEGPPEVRWLGSSGNRLSQDRNLLRSLYVVAVPGQATFKVSSRSDRFGRFTGDGTYECMFLTNTVTSVDFGFDPGDSVYIDAIRPVYVLESGVPRPNSVVYVQAGETPNIDQKSITKFTDEEESADSDEWLSTGDAVTGEFFKFALLFPEVESPLVKEVAGLQIRFRRGGKSN